MIWNNNSSKSFGNYHASKGLALPNFYGMFSPLLTGVRQWMIFGVMKKKEPNRAADRIRKTLSLPDKLAARIQEEADAKYGGDFTRATLEILATKYPQAREFLRTNETHKFANKSRPKKK